MTNYPRFEHNKIFIKKSHFYPLINASHMVHFQKNLMNRFREKSKCIYFGPKNDSFLLFGGGGGGKIGIFLKILKQPPLPNF